MKKSTVKDVKRFLAAFVDVVVDNDVKLTKGCWVDGNNHHCLLGELICRGGSPVRAVLRSDEAAKLLGVTWKEVDNITAGWDGSEDRGPFCRAGQWLRARYIARITRRNTAQED